ncbi:MAG TPA: hypothetical protein VHV76_11415 [Mycobacteriales bacterium]|nr:hypothetical protein [Mycobacteriales bacterium]
MRRAAVRVLVGGVALAAVAACSGGSSSGGKPPSAAATGDQTVIVATPRTDASTDQLEAAATVLSKRFAGLGVKASIDTGLSPGGTSTLKVSVTPQDVAAAKFLITEQGLLEVRRVLDARSKPAQRCRNNSKAFPASEMSSGDAVLCDPADGLILLLAPAALDQGDIASASASETAIATATAGSGWQVTFKLTASGATSWRTLTEAAYAATGSADAGFGSCHPPRGCNAFAFVIDGATVEVASSPSTGGIPGDLAGIFGFQEPVAKRLVATVNSGPLPVALTVNG